MVSKNMKVNKWWRDEFFFFWFIFSDIWKSNKEKINNNNIKFIDDKSENDFIY